VKYLKGAQLDQVPALFTNIRLSCRAVEAVKRRFCPGKTVVECFTHNCKIGTSNSSTRTGIKKLMEIADRIATSIAGIFRIGKHRPPLHECII